MRRNRLHTWLLTVFVVSASLTQFSSAQAQRATELINGHKAAKGEVLVKFRQVSPTSITALTRNYDLSLHHSIGRVKNLYHLRSRSWRVAMLLKELSARSDVVYAEPNYQLKAAEVPNDPQFGDQWALQNTGQSSDGFGAGTPGADISAVSAWDLSTGSTSQVVGIVDTGIDYTHPDLAANIWSAPASFTVTISDLPVTCAAGTHGFNAIELSCDPMDDYMHGTHVAGIIGASGNNNLGVAGVNWTTQMMGLKFLNSQGYGYTSDAVNAIDFAIQVKALFASTNGANVRILSNSWGGSGFSQALVDEINAAANNDMLFVAAAGNSSANIDVMPMYPASYNLPSEIAVAATDNNDALADFSNYSPDEVHLGAPGVDVLSTLPAGTYGYLSGTSMATPHVSGTAALMLSICNLHTSDLKKNLLDNVDSIPSLTGKTITGGRLNVYHALESCNGPVGVSPVAINFGTLLVGKASPAKVVTLTNYQTVTLNLSSILASGDFAQTNNCGNAVAAGANCALNVTFTPSASGNRTGQVQVFDDASNSPQVVTLSGAGTISPDLVASASTSLSLTSPGSPLTVNYTVLNQGSADASATVTGFYVSLTTKKDTTAVLMGSVNTFALLAGNSFSSAATVTIPASVKPGPYYVLACADDTNVVAESDETNNCGASATLLQLQLPDLTESSVSYTPPSNGTLQISDTATNLGSVSAAATVTQYYVSSGNWKSTSSQLLTGSRSVPQLGPGITSTGTTTVTVPSSVAVGNYYVLACADDTNVVPESNETNNCAAAPNQVQVGPDLIESGVSTSTTMTGAGSALQVNDTATNQGAWSAATSFTQYYLSPYTTKTSASRLLSGNRSVPTLAAGATSSGTATVMVPSDMAVGSYYLLACADDTSLVPETNENNNCASYSTRLQVGPDLIESGVSTTATAVGPSSVIVVNDTTSNQGGSAAAASVTQYYLSPYNSKTGASQLLGGNRSVSALAAGGSSAGSTSVTVPSTITVGSYYLLACADDTNLVPETNETNNCTAASAKVLVGPDLIESAVSTTATAAGPGSILLVNDTATNQGAGNAAASVTQYYLSPYNSKTGASQLLSGNRGVAALTAGASSTGSATVTVPSNMAVGSYYLLACADDTNLVPETNETNNCAAGAVKVLVGPDLIESGVSSATNLIGAGSILQVSDTATNQGGSNAAASVTQYYLSPYNSKTGASQLLSGNRGVAALTAGASSTGSATLTVPSNMAVGSYYLLACADDTNLVPETNETNNCVATTVKLQVGPDLIESGVSGGSTQTTPGATLQVNDTTINQGGGNAASSVTQYYLSPYNSKTGASQLLSGNRAIPALTAGTSSAGSVTVTVPSNLTLGTYYLLACADDTSLVPETSETNNCTAWGTKVTVVHP